MATKERFKMIPCVYVVLIKEEKVLLIRRFNTGYEDGNYGLPSGHVEGEETMREAAAREALEEIGIKISPISMKHIHTQHRYCGNGHERVEVFFMPEQWQGEATNMEPEKCDDVQWFPLNSLPQNIVPYIGDILASILKGETYSEFGWE